MGTKPNWEAMAEWQHIILKYVYSVIPETIDDIYNSGMGLNEYKQAIRVYEEIFKEIEKDVKRKNTDKAIAALLDGEMEY